MKCPKCEYLGYETSDRCRNCGYDFSLTPAGADADLPLRPAHRATDAADLWLREPASAAAPHVPSAAPVELPLRTTIDAAAVPEPEQRSAPPTSGLAVDAAPSLRDVPPRRTPPEPALPLFTEDDEPLVRVSRTPRAPLSVRRTPTAPRVKSATITPSLPPMAAPADLLPPAESPGTSSAAPTATAARASQHGLPCAWSRRIAAVAIDRAILGSIELAVIYFTLRVASLETGDWRMLPVLPLVAFLAVIELAYYGVFTAIGGQTIGKMAVHLRVVTDDGGEVDAARAAQRALIGIVSVVTCGAAFLPGVLGDGRALHDRTARTRVVRFDPA